MLHQEVKILDTYKLSFSKANTVILGSDYNMNLRLGSWLVNNKNELKWIVTGIVNNPVLKNYNCNYQIACEISAAINTSEKELQTGVKYYLLIKDNIFLK